MRQGGDVGTQYRSAIYVLTPEQEEQAHKSRELFQQAMEKAGDQRVITSEITVALPFYYAEDDHQQYLHKILMDTVVLGIGVCMPPNV